MERPITRKEKLDQTANFRLKHATADIEPGVSIHYVTAGEGPRTVVLLHGFPQTWHAWRHTIPLLVEAGFHVVAPD